MEILDVSSNTFIQPHTFASVTQAFDHWRATRTERSRTPVSLQRHAAALLCSHPASHICTVLKVNDTALKRWAADLSPTPADSLVAQPPFIELPAVSASNDAPTSEHDCRVLSLEFGDGIKLQVNGQFTLEQILNAAHRHRQGVRS